MTLQTDLKTEAHRTPVYTVEGLLRTAAMTQQSRIVSRIGDIVRVKGEVIKANVYNKSRYITLRDQEARLKVKINASEPVELHDILTVEGTLFLNPHRYEAGLEALVDGHVIDRSNAPPENSSIDTAGFNKDQFTRLGQFLSAQSVSQLMLLGSKTALTDVFTQIDEPWASKIPRNIIRVSGGESILQDVKAIDMRHIKALAFVRGGDDPSMNVWDDPNVVRFIISLGMPFYSALGHSHNMTLCDRYADEAFPVPGALGAAINDNLKRSNEVILLKQKCKNLQESMAQYPSNRNGVDSGRIASKEKFKVFGLGVISGLIVFGILWVRVKFF